MAETVRPVRLRLSELKQRSEQAVPILRRHFADRLYGEVFPAEAGENHHGLLVACDCPNASKDHGCQRCAHPSAGTPMIGGMSGYEEPEWDEETTYELLLKVLTWTDKPDSMTDAEWVEALAVVQMTPASHAEGIAAFEHEMATADIDTPISPLSDLPTTGDVG